ncbi:hypothetical protein B0H13DRAFT_1851910 [Mycena leptocephala]|nr:hypothetical protein B0H13DRAFT_1851910 [Mycena leptocephala]
MPGPSAAPKPKGVRVDLNRQIQLDPHTLAIPTHVQASLKAQWNKLFPLSDLTPKNCLSTDKARINRPTTKLTLVDNALVMKEVDRDITKEDESMTSTEFVTAGNRLVEAIQEHFKPREKAEQLAGQVAIHFDAIRLLGTRPGTFLDVAQVRRERVARRDLGERTRSGTAEGDREDEDVAEDGYELVEVLSERRRRLEPVVLSKPRRKRRERRGGREPHERWQQGRGKGPARRTATALRDAATAENPNMTPVIAPRRRVHGARGTGGPGDGRRRSLPSASAGATTALPAATTSRANTPTFACYAEQDAVRTPEQQAQPTARKPAAPSPEIFPIVTPLKADRWQHWIKVLGVAKEYADVPEGIRNGSSHGLDPERKATTTFIPRNLMSVLEI